MYWQLKNDNYDPTFKLDIMLAALVLLIGMVLVAILVNGIY